MRQIIIYVSVLIAAVVCACNSPQLAIADLENLVSDVEMNHESYTAQDWDNVVASYSIIEEEMLQYDYTDEELKEIGRLKGRYLGYVTKQAIKETEKQANDFLKELGGGISGFLEAMSEETTEEFK